VRGADIGGERVVGLIQVEGFGREFGRAGDINPALRPYRENPGYYCFFEADLRGDLLATGLRKLDHLRSGIWG